jgi:hypothetical protein
MYRKANGKEEFYSICSGKTTASANVSLHVDEDGNPTIDYPHVHVVHHANGRVDVLANVAKVIHPWRI